MTTPTEKGKGASAPAPAPPPFFHCRWTPEDMGGWGTSCDGLFEFIEDGPVENHIRFCPYCGKPIELMEVP